METKKEECLLLLKPDCIAQHLIGEILSRIEKTGLHITRLSLVNATETLIGKHYPDDPSWLKSVGLKKIQKFQSLGKKLSVDSLSIGIRVRNNLIEYFAGKKIIALTVEGANAIACMRKLAGNTEPFSSLPGTIRGDYSTDSYETADILDRPIQNLIHVSDSPESSQREITIWFSNQDRNVG